LKGVLDSGILSQGYKRFSFSNPDIENTIVPKSLMYLKKLQYQQRGFGIVCFMTNVNIFPTI